MDALGELLLDEQGHLRSFARFRKAAEQVIGKYNVEWLRTEYNTAVLRARAAVQWRDALQTRDLFPNLEYLESDSVMKREEHLHFVGTVRPIEDPWWDTHTPPLAWNCKCRLRPTDKEITPIPSEGPEDAPAPGLDGNPGREGSCFHLPSHPYTRGMGDPHCPECRRQGLVPSAQLLDYEDVLCEEHRKALEALKDDLKKQQKLADKIVKKWSQEHIPDGGLLVKDPKFYTGVAAVNRHSVKDLADHLADPLQKALATKIEEILEECRPKAECPFAPLNEDAHNYDKKVARGVIGYAYYEIDVSGDIYQLDMEVRNVSGVIDERPYTLRCTKKKGL